MPTWDELAKQGGHEFRERVQNALNQLCLTAPSVEEFEATLHSLDLDQRRALVALRDKGLFTGFDSRAYWLEQGHQALENKVRAVRAGEAQRSIDDQRECPWCASEVSKTAEVCRHCGRDLADHEEVRRTYNAEVQRWRAEELEETEFLIRQVRCYMKEEEAAAATRKTGLADQGKITIISRVDVDLQVDNGEEEITVKAWSSASQRHTIP